MAQKEEIGAQTFKRNTRSNRGHPGQNRLYNKLGVKDLRELLDRKRAERRYNSTEANIPPPDPLREDDENNSQEQPNKANKIGKCYTKNNAGNFKRDKELLSENLSNHPKNKDIENALNIKVEFSTSTGKHIYKIDETKILPTIKHVPDKLSFQNRSFKGGFQGRGRGQQRTTYQTRTIRSNNRDIRTLKNGLSGDKQATIENLISVVYDTDENWDSELNANKNDIKNKAEEEFNDDAHEEQHIQDVLQAGVQSLSLEENNNATGNVNTDDKN